MIFISVILVSSVFMGQEDGDYSELSRCFENVGSDERRQIALISSYVILKQCIHSLVWLASYYLLIYQYRKGLSETWYSHKAFWYLSSIADLSIFIYGSFVNQYYKSIFIISLYGIRLIINFILVILLLNTQERTLEKPRPDILIGKDGEIIEQLENGQSRTTSFGNYGHRGLLPSS